MDAGYVIRRHFARPQLSAVWRTCVAACLKYARKLYVVKLFQRLSDVIQSVSRDTA